MTKFKLKIEMIEDVYGNCIGTEAMMVTTNENTPISELYYLMSEVDGTFQQLKDERDHALGSRDQWEIVAKDRQSTVNDLKTEVELAKSMNAQLRQAPHQWLPGASDQAREEP